jgi:arsenate reductase
MIQIIHNPRCAKSREGLNYLKDKGISFQEIRYLEHPLTKEEVKTILKKLGIKPIEWVRKQEEIYKTLLKDNKLSDEAWVDALVKYPKLMERPVIINGDKAIIARPASRIEEIL